MSTSKVIVLIIMGVSILSPLAFAIFSDPEKEEKKAKTVMEELDEIDRQSGASEKKNNQ